MSASSNSKKLAVVAAHQAPPPYKLTSYLLGFALSLYLTLMAYVAVVHHLFSRRILLFVLPGLALTQFVVQMIFFLHIGREFRPRWKLFVFLFMLLIVTILVGGSIWIMSNLNYHMQTPAEVNKYLQSQDGL
jgi:cytochrome o ubiquinol oxidase operon protein cyoD